MHVVRGLRQAIVMAIGGVLSLGGSSVLVAGLVLFGSG
jgi:hypothetical protein